MRLLHAVIEWSNLGRRCVGSEGLTAILVPEQPAQRSLIHVFVNENAVILLVTVAKKLQNVVMPQVRYLLHLLPYDDVMAVRDWFFGQKFMCGGLYYESTLARRSPATSVCVP